MLLRLVGSLAGAMLVLTPLYAQQPPVPHEGSFELAQAGGKGGGGGGQAGGQGPSAGGAPSGGGAVGRGGAVGGGGRGGGAMSSGRSGGPSSGPSAGSWRAERGGAGGGAGSARERGPREGRSADRGGREAHERRSSRIEVPVARDRGDDRRRGDVRGGGDWRGRTGDVRRYGRRHAWGPGNTYWFYEGYYYGDCDWLRRRAVATGSRYWWERYRLCRDAYW